MKKKIIIAVAVVLCLAVVGAIIAASTINKRVDDMIGYSKITQLIAQNDITGDRLELPFEYKEGIYMLDGRATAFKTKETARELQDKISNAETQDKASYSVACISDDFLLITKEAYSGRRSFFCLRMSAADKRGVYTCMLFDCSARFVSHIEGTTSEAGTAEDETAFLAQTESIRIALPYQLFDKDAVSDCLIDYELGKPYLVTADHNEFLSFYKSLSAYAILEGKDSFSLESTNCENPEYKTLLPIKFSFDYDGNEIYLTITQGRAEISEEMFTIVE